MRSFYVGLDLGQQDDFTAVSIIERVEIKGEPRVERTEYPPQLSIGWHGTEYEAVYGSQPSAEVLARLGFPTVVEEKIVQDESVEYHLRHLERLPLGTSYVAVVRHVAELVRRPELASGYVELILDATGVGRPIVDMVRAADLPCGVWPVTITGTDKMTQEGREFHTPKRDLASAVLRLGQEGRLKIAKGIPFREILVAELKNFRAKITLSGHDSYEAGPAGEWREGAHDDLVLAVALACWFPERNSGSGVYIHFFD